MNFIAFLHGTLEGEFGDTAVFQARNGIDGADDCFILDSEVLLFD